MNSSADQPGKAVTTRSYVKSARHFHDCARRLRTISPSRRNSGSRYSGCGKSFWLTRYDLYLTVAGSVVDQCFFFTLFFGKGIREVALSRITQRRVCPCQPNANVAKRFELTGAFTAFLHAAESLSTYVHTRHFTYPRLLAQFRVRQTLGRRCDHPIMKITFSNASLLN